MNSRNLIITFTFLLQFHQLSYATGPGIGGGGNTTEDGQPVAAYKQIIKDPKQEPLLHGAWSLVEQFEKMVEATTVRADFKKLMRYAITHKTWYLFQVPFENLPNERVGTKAKIKQPIYQLSNEIHISAPLIKELRSQKGLPALRELLLREFIESLMILSRNSPFEQCLGYAPEETHCEGYSKVPVGSLELGANEHSHVRIITNKILELLSNSKPSSQFINDLVESFIRNYLMINGQWFYGFLGDHPMSIDDLEQFYRVAIQNQKAHERNREFATCLEGIRLHSPTKANLGKTPQLIMEFPYQGQLYGTNLEVNYCTPDESKNGISNCNGNARRDANGKLVYNLAPIGNFGDYNQLYYVLSAWSPTEKSTPEVGSISASARLFFEKDNLEFRPVGIEYFINMITSVEETTSGWHAHTTQLQSAVCRLN